MAENTISSDFLNRVVEVTEELNQMIESASDGKHRAIVILAAEEVSENTSANAIALCGRSKEAIAALHDFATQPATKDVFRIVATKMAIDNFNKQ